MDPNNIPMPAEQEKQEAISQILDAAFPRPVSFRRELWDTLCIAGIRTVFCGVGDCLALAVLLWAFCLFPASYLANRAGGLAQVLLLLSPLLYAALSLLTAWKDLQIGIREWTCTFRISAQIVSALRMLCFGAASVLVCVPANLLLWSVSGHLHPLGWMLALSLSSLFLYGTLSLLCLRLRGIVGILAAPIIWLIVGMVLLMCPPAAEWLNTVPTIVFCLIFVGTLILYLREMRRFCRRYIEGGFSYALR